MIISQSVEAEDYTPILGKFADWSDNFIGKDGLSLDDVTRNLLKIWFGASEVYSAGLNVDYINSFVSELLESAYVASEHLIMKDLMSSQLQVRVYTSTLQKINKLSPLLFTDKTV
jgi:hypothetical protein